MRHFWRAALVLVAATALTACGERMGMTVGTTPAAAPAPAAPPVDMAGRWTLSAGGRGCAMNFGPGQQGAEGAIRPEGGCPGNFYTSRKWSFDASGLQIHDHTGATLAHLRLSSPGRFDGQAAAGGPVTLTR
jgi:hypothetical protein